MTLTAIECNPGSEALVAITKGLETAGLAIDAFVSGDFVKTVRSLTGSTTYHADRGAGVVGAKTLNLRSGPVVIFNWNHLAGQDAHGLERTAAHEAGHALLYSRGEHATGFQNLAASEAAWHFQCIGSYAVEEFRIESGLSAQGYSPWMTEPITHLRDALAELNYQVVSSVLDETTPTEMRDNVLAAQDVFSKVLAYSAAAYVSGTDLDVTALTGDSVEDWNDYVGDEWDSRLQLWTSLPDARHPLNTRKWSETLVAGAAIEERFMTRMGFAYQSWTPGFKFRRLGSDTLFETRLQRAKRTLAAD